MNDRGWILIMDDEALIRELVEFVIQHFFPEASGRVKSFSSRREVGRFIYNSVVRGGDRLDLLITDNNTAEGQNMGWELADLVFKSSGVAGLKDSHVLIMSGVSGDKEDEFISFARIREAEFRERFSFSLKPSIVDAVILAVRKVAQVIA